MKSEGTAGWLIVIVVPLTYRVILVLEIETQGNAIGGGVVE